jgi:guanylate kinase
VISAPAGTGKTTLTQMLLDEFPHAIERALTCTTRSPRAGEVDGDHYLFIRTQAFEEKIAQHQLLEYVQLYGHYYGTLRSTIEEKQKKNKHIILVIDTQGALQIKGKIPAVFIFIQPPSLEVLQERLVKRQTETQQTLQERLTWADKEMQQAIHYDYCIVNDHLKTAYQVLRSIVIAEDHRLEEIDHGF